MLADHMNPELEGLCGCYETIYKQIPTESQSDSQVVRTPGDEHLGEADSLGRTWLRTSYQGSKDVRP